jgi:hypothetical protein
MLHRATETFTWNPHRDSADYGIHDGDMGVDVPIEMLQGWREEYVNNESGDAGESSAAEEQRQLQETHARGRQSSASAGWYDLSQTDQGDGGFRGRGRAGGPGPGGGRGPSEGNRPGGRPSPSGGRSPVAGREIRARGRGKAHLTASDHEASTQATNGSFPGNSPKLIGVLHAVDHTQHLMGTDKVFCGSGFCDSFREEFPSMMDTGGRGPSFPHSPSEFESDSSQHGSEVEGDLEDIRFSYRPSTWTTNHSTYEPSPAPFIEESTGLRGEYHEVPSYMELFSKFWTFHMLRDI